MAEGAREAGLVVAVAAAEVVGEAGLVEAETAEEGARVAGVMVEAGDWEAEELAVVEDPVVVALHQRPLLNK